MNQKFAKMLRKAAGYNPKQTPDYNGRGIVSVEHEKVRVCGVYTMRKVERRGVGCAVKKIPASVEGYFWKPRAPAMRDGFRYVLQPVTLVSNTPKAAYRRLKRYAAA